MQKLKSLLPYVLGIVVLLVSLTIVNLVRTAGESAAKAAHFEEKLAQSEDVTDEFKKALKAYQDSVKSWRKQDSVAKAQAEWKKTQAGRRLGALREAVNTSPDTCKPALLEAIATADSFRAVADTFASLYDREKRHSAQLAAVLLKSQDALAAKDRALDAAPLRESFWKKLQPEVRVGPFAGVCFDGRPCAGVGIQVSAKIGRIL